jgi:hypothetical protein
MTTPVPLMMQTVLNTASDIVLENLRATFERGYTPFVASEVQTEKPVSIVGAGSSLSDTYKDIVGDVIACNSAHDFLIGKGVIPKYAMIWDANPIMGKMITKPHPEVTYLVASRCHPSVFEGLKDFKVIVWHALGGEDIEKILIEKNLLEPMIAGGSSGVTRSLFLAGALGYSKEMHLFGVCDAGDGKTTHVMGSLIKQNFIDIRVCGKWWKLAPWMAMQAADFKTLVPILKSKGVKIIVHGKGFLPYTATFLNVETPDLKVTLYEKLRRELHALVLLYLEFRNTPNYIGGFNAG